MAAPVLSVRNLNVSTRSHAIIRNVSFDVPEASTTGLYGDSGSGKTTILHAICGLLNPVFRTSGEMLLRGQPIDLLSPDQRSRLGISIVLQDLGLFADRSIFENVAYPLRRRGMSGEDIARSVEEMLSLLQIDHLAARLPREISGGQKQRAALARALAYKPSLLLLDEPLRGLQEGLRFEFLAFLRTFAQRGTTILFVTHDRTELDLVADSIITIMDGTINETEALVPGNCFASLGHGQVLPLPGQRGEQVRAQNVRLAHSGDCPERLLRGEALEWRVLGDGRIGALMTFAGGTPRWVIFDSEIPASEERQAGPIEIFFKLKGE